MIPPQAPDGADGLLPRTTRLRVANDAERALAEETERRIEAEIARMERERPSLYIARPNLRRCAAPRCHVSRLPDRMVRVGTLWYCPLCAKAAERGYDDGARESPGAWWRAIPVTVQLALIAVACGVIAFHLGILFRGMGCGW